MVTITLSAVLVLLQSTVVSPDIDAGVDAGVDAGIDAGVYDYYIEDPAVDVMNGVDRNIQRNDPDWEAPKTIATKAPKYPVDYYRNPVTTTVVVDVYIDERGMVTNAVIRSSGGTEFDMAALETVYTWSYLPAYYKNEPSAAVLTVPVEFTPDMIPGWEEPADSGDDEDSTAIDILMMGAGYLR